MTNNMLEYVKSLPQYRTIVGNERVLYLEMFEKIVPSESSNNQRFITDVYHINGNEFHVTYGLEDSEGNNPTVEILVERTA